MSTDIRLIAFYLPQFHPIPENDRWWGKGFTEWTNVVRGSPQFPGHYQPQLPADLGFYDLRVPEVREAQARLAAEYGIAGFCYHHYWFGGKRLLERPFNEVLASGKPDFPFCLCWANENWTRRWDGLESEVLIRQQHSDRDDIAFIHSLFPAFRDRRYIRVNGKPLLIVYRTTLLPDPARTARIWREEAHKAGLGELYLCRAETFTSYGQHEEPGRIGFDAALEFPPHAIFSARVHESVLLPDSDFEGEIFDYRHVMYHALIRRAPSFPLFRGVMPSWDNTARKRNKSYVFLHSSPGDYERWLTETVRLARIEHPDEQERLIFINAWNEWAEGCHLEPDQRYGLQYLEATRRALQQAEPRSSLIARCAKLADRPAGEFERNPLAASEVYQSYVREVLDASVPDRPDLSDLVRSSSLRFRVARALLTDDGPFRRLRRLLYLALRQLFRLGRWSGVVR
jgi:lipopolysaccharide biosynthesis protein